MSDRTITGERLHKLRVFAAVVERGSMTAAAASLGISRSVVSGHLKHLEDDLGVRLIERTTRSMHVTHVGEQVYERTRMMLESAQAALDVVDSHLGSVSGVVRVALPVDLGNVVLAPVVEQLKHEHPRVRLEILVGDAPIDIVRDGVDVAVRIGIPQDSGLILKRLCRTDEIFVACPALADEIDAGGVRAMEHVPRVAHSVVDHPRPTLRHPDGRSEVVALPVPVVTVGSSELIRRLVLRGIGVALLPELLVREQLVSGALVRVAAPWTRRSLDVYALTPSRVTSPAVEAFITALRGHLR